MKASSIIQSCKLAQQDDLVRPFLAKFYLTLNFSSVMDHCHFHMTERISFKIFNLLPDDFPHHQQYSRFFSLLNIDALK